MTDELSPELIRRKAERARQLQSSEAFQEFITDTTARIVEDWKRAETPVEREVCHSQIRGIRALNVTLQSAIDAADVQDYHDAKKALPLAQTVRS